MNLLISDRSNPTIPKGLIDSVERYEFDSAITARESWRSGYTQDNNQSCPKCSQRCKPILVMLLLLLSGISFFMLEIASYSEFWRFTDYAK